MHHAVSTDDSGTRRSGSERSASPRSCRMDVASHPFASTHAMRCGRTHPCTEGAAVAVGRNLCVSWRATAEVVNWAKDLLFEIERHGFVEETYFDVSYDPVRVESGNVGGVYCIVTETTDRVVAARRMALLKDLAAQPSFPRTTREACSIAIETLANHPHDIAFALAYIDDELQACTPGAEHQLANGA